MRRRLNGSRARLDVVEKRKFSVPVEHQTPIPWSIVS
jgi:hypothetical protein